MTGPEVSSSTESLDPGVAGRETTGDAGAPGALVGSTLAGRFRVLRLIDRGPSGDLYEGRDLFLEASIMLAVVPAELSADPRAMEVLRRELLQARRVGHPAVCRVHDLHQDSEGGLTFVAMEHLDGVTLASRLRDTGGLRTAEALPILEQLARGLAALHEGGITGGALQPSDVMLLRTATGVRAVILPAALLTRGRASPRTPDSGPGDAGWDLAPLAREIVTAGEGDTPTGRPLPPGWSTALGREPRGPEALARALRRATPRARPGARLVLPTLLALAAMGGGLLWRATDRRPPRPLLPSLTARVAVAPVRAAAGANDATTRALAAALRTELSMPGPVRACAEEETSVSLRRFPPSRIDVPPPGLLDSLRTLSNAATLLLVDARRIGDAVEVELGLYRTTDERRLGSTRVRGLASRFPDLARAMGDSARRLLAMPPLPATDRAALTTAHPPSLELADRLLRAKQPSSAGDDPVQQLEPVVREAPDFAPGLDAYADALLAAGRGKESFAIRQRAVSAASGLPELFRLWIERTAHAVDGDQAQLAQVEKRMFELVPEELYAVLAPRGRSPEQQRKDLLGLRSSGSFLTLQPDVDAREAALALMGGDPPAALEAVARGEAKIPDFEDRDRRFQLFWWSKENALRQVGRYEEALIEDRTALEMARAESDPKRVMRLKVLTAATLHGLRRYESAVAELQEALTLSRSGGTRSPALELPIIDRTVYYLVDLGDLPRATRTMDEAAERHPDALRSSLSFIEFRLLIAIEEGRWPEAERHRRALRAVPDGEAEARSTLLTLARERDDRTEVTRIHAVPVARGGLATRFVDQYLDIEDATIAEDGMDQLPPARWSELPPLRLRTDRHGSRSVAARLRSRVALGSGDVPTAATAADEALAEALRYPKPEAEWLARLQLARVRLARGDSQGAEETLHPVDEVARRGSRRLELEAALVRADGSPAGTQRTGALRAVAGRASALGFKRIARLALAKARSEPPGAGPARPQRPTQP